MKTDKFGEVINCKETFKDIASNLKYGRSSIIGWTDEEGSHFDILFSRDALYVPGNILQGGISPFYLFVSIMRVGCFAFDIENDDTFWTYYDEKLGGHWGETTGKKIAELINRVKKELKNET